MSESVVADFIGRYYVDSLDGKEPVSGRILLSQKRLVLAGDEEKTTVPLATVFDVTVGFVPPGLEQFFTDTVTVAYRKGDRKRIAVVEGNGDNVGRFTTVLFRVLLNGTKVSTIHPARVGGRVTDATSRPAKLVCKPGLIRFATGDGGFSIDLGSISDIERTTRSVGGKNRTVLEISHLDDESALTTIAALPSARKTNILGRYVRLEYGNLREEVVEMSHTDEEMEALIALYSTGGSANLGTLLNAEPAQITMVLNSLRDADLVADSDGVTKLTSKGRIAVTTHLEQVNN